MWIRLNQKPRRFRPLVLAPDLAPGNEESLRGSVAVLFFFCFRVLGEAVEQRSVGKPEAAIIRCILAKGKLATDVDTRQWLKARVLFYDAVGQNLEFFLVLFLPPILEIAARIELSPFVIEPVCQFMADD